NDSQTTGPELGVALVAFVSRVKCPSCIGAQFPYFSHQFPPREACKMIEDGRCAIPPELSRSAALFSVWIPPGLDAAFKVPMHMLGFAELFQALFAKFAAAAAELKATERSGIIISERVINPESPCLNLL